MPGSVCSPSPIRIPHEKNIPALSKASCPPIRLSGPHAHQERSRHPGPPPCQGPRPPRRCPHRAQVHAPHSGLISAVAAVYDRRSVPEHSASISDPTPSQALPRARVIRRRGVFDATRLKGKRVSNRFMALNHLPKEAVKSGETGEVAFLTPKRLGAANKRTQLRRRMREIYRRHLARPSEQMFLIWIARPPALELPFEELKKCMSALRERATTAS